MSKAPLGYLAVPLNISYTLASVAQGPVAVSLDDGGQAQLKKLHYSIHQDSRELM